MPGRPSADPGDRDHRKLLICMELGRLARPGQSNGTKLAFDLLTLL
jgi:hypothetical protein